MEVRLCINCGKTFEVDNRKGRKDDSKGRILCNDCLDYLTIEERNKIYQNHSKEKNSEDRECIGCGNIFRVKKSKNPKTSKIRLFCDECNKTLTNYQKKKIKMDKDPIYREQCLEAKRLSYKKNIVHNMWKKAKIRAEKYGYEFNIEESDIIIPKVCPLLNIPIVLGSKNDYEQTPSIDRIDNTKGYIKGNIWVISKKANSMKNSATYDELNTFTKNIIRYSLNNSEKEGIELEDKEPQG